MLLDIAEVARRSGLRPSALRYYERQGLIESSGRNGLRRSYLPDIIPRLTLIACARSVGFTLDQIGRFLVAKPDDTRLKARLAERANALDDEIERLTRMRDSLKHAAVCHHSPLVECPHFKLRIEGATVTPATDDCRNPPAAAPRTPAAPSAITPIESA
jgi:DNA-binding transcriptional MerR regulator